MSNSSKALTRIESILDGGSFAELGGRVKARNTDFNCASGSPESDGVVTGYGSIGGRPVYIFAQDPDVLGGSVGEMHAEKILRIYKLALTSATPVIGLIDCSGIRLNEGVDALSAFGKLYKAQADAKGTIPQVFGIFGTCGGSMAISAGLADIVLTSKDAKVFVNPAAARDYSGIRSGIGKALACDPAGGAISSFCGSEAETLEAIRTLYDFLPLSYNYQATEIEGSDDPNRVCEGLGAGADVITAVADEGRVAWTAKNESFSAGFARLGGKVAAIAQGLGKALDASDLSALASFVDFASCFDIPIVTITDFDGFSTAEGQEERLPFAAASLAESFALADVPRINLISGKAGGSIYALMNSKETGADMTFAWDSADLSIIPAKDAVRIIYSEEILKESDQNAFIAEKIAEYEKKGGAEAFLSRGLVDKIIDPVDTRKYLIGALQMLSDKGEF